MNVYTWMFVQKNLFPYDRIIEAFEVIVVSTVQNENFTEILIEENDVALLAERVRLSYEGVFALTTYIIVSVFNPGPLGMCIG